MRALLALSFLRERAQASWRRFNEMHGMPIPRLRRFRGRGRGLSGNAHQRRKARRARAMAAQRAAPAGPRSSGS